MLVVAMELPSRWKEKGRVMILLLQSIDDCSQIVLSLDECLFVEEVSIKSGQVLPWLLLDLHLRIPCCFTLTNEDLSR
jgi:hypothetical protein